MQEADSQPLEYEPYLLSTVVPHEQLGRLGLLAVSVHGRDLDRFLQNYDIPDYAAFTSEGARRICIEINDDQQSSDTEAYRLRRKTTTTRLCDDDKFVELHSDDLGAELVEAMSEISERELYEQCDPRYRPVLFILSIFTDEQRAAYEQEQPRRLRPVGRPIFLEMLEPPSYA